MKYGPEKKGIVYYPKLFGTYEKELWSIIEQLCKYDFKTVVNVGSAEGYYAVGFALRLPHANIEAFEAVEINRHHILAMAALNNVSNKIHVHGLCDFNGLTNVMKNDPLPLVIMDIEGAESILLDPLAIPKLKTAHIVVELHDFIFPEIGDILTERFITTHKIQEIWSTERKLDDLPISFPKAIHWYIKKSFINLMSEKRPGAMRWFYLTPLVQDGIPAELKHRSSSHARQFIFNSARNLALKAPAFYKSNWRF